MTSRETTDTADRPHQNTTAAGAQENDSELGFSDLVRIAWDQKITLLVATLVVVVLGVVYLKFATYIYSASLRLTPVQQSSSALDSRLSGLASMAGINLAQEQTVSPFTLFVDGIKSRQTADELARNQSVMQTVFANQWDGETASWREPTGLGYLTRKLGRTIFGGGNQPWSPPGGAELEQYLRKTVRVDQRPGEPIVSIRFNHPDPAFAETFVAELHQITDEFLRRRTLVRTDQYISYLTEQMNSVTIAEHRQALALAFSEQEKLRMMADSGLPFAAEPFGPIATSSGPVAPRPSVVLLSCLVLGALSGILVIAARRSIASVRER